MLMFAVFGAFGSTQDLGIQGFGGRCLGFRVQGLGCRDFASNVKLRSHAEPLPKLHPKNPCAQNPQPLLEHL